MSKKRCYVQRMLMCSLLAGGCFCLPGYAGGGDKPEAGMKTDVVDDIAQTRKISGVVLDDMGPVIGANVSVRVLPLVLLRIWMEDLLLKFRRMEFLLFRLSVILHGKSR